MNDGTTNWRVFILPFIEQQALYSSLDMSAPFVSGLLNNAGAPNAMLKNLLISTYLCPSYPMDPFSDLSGMLYGSAEYYNSGPVMAINYSGIAGAYPDPGPSASESGRSGGSAANPDIYMTTAWGTIANTGMMLMNEASSVASTLDGTSNTLMVAEQGKKSEDTAGRAGFSFSCYGGGWRGVRYEQTLPQEPRSMTVRRFNEEGYTSFRVYAPSIITIQYRINAKPLTGYCIYMYQNNMVISSEHAGGANGVLGDGSVRFLSETMDFWALRALCSRNEGASISL